MCQKCGVEGDWRIKRIKSDRRRQEGRRKISSSSSSVTTAAGDGEGRTNAIEVYCHRTYAHRNLLRSNFFFSFSLSAFYVQQTLLLFVENPTYINYTIRGSVYNVSHIRAVPGDWCKGKWKYFTMVSTSYRRRRFLIEKFLRWS